MELYIYVFWPCVGWLAKRAGAAVQFAAWLDWDVKEWNHWSCSSHRECPTRRFSLVNLPYLEGDPKSWLPWLPLAAAASGSFEAIQKWSGKPVVKASGGRTSSGGTVACWSTIIWKKTTVGWYPHKRRPRLWPVAVWLGAYGVVQGEDVPFLWLRISFPIIQ